MKKFIVAITSTLGIAFTLLFGLTASPIIDDFYSDSTSFCNIADSEVSFLDYAVSQGISYFTLTNLIVNGDFSLDTNFDGLANNWYVQSNTIPSINYDFQRSSNNLVQTNASIYQSNLLFTVGNTFYVNAFWNKSIDFIGGQYLEMGGVTNQTVFFNTSANWNYSFSGTFISTYANTRLKFYSYNASNFPIGAYHEISNVFLFDLGVTPQFTKQQLDDLIVYYGYFEGTEILLDVSNVNFNRVYKSFFGYSTSFDDFTLSSLSETKTMPSDLIVTLNGDCTSIVDIGVSMMNEWVEMAKQPIQLTISNMIPYFRVGLSTFVFTSGSDGVYDLDHPDSTWEWFLHDLLKGVTYGYYL